MPYNIGHSIL